MIEPSSYKATTYLYYQLKSHFMLKNYRTVLKAICTYIYIHTRNMSKN